MNRWIDAGWPDLVAGTTVRLGGVSGGPYTGLNLGASAGDDQGAVADNRLQLAEQLGAEVCWLEQVHGTRVVERHAGNVSEAPEADAHWTVDQSLVLAVLTADCLPVLMVDGARTCVAAAHAGWRGLAAGVLQETVAALPVAAETLEAWIGPAIGGSCYEVGPDVREAFPDSAGSCFAPGQGDRFWLDTAAVAAKLLSDLGVSVRLSGYCTHRDQRFYSYRRDGVTGRQASFVQRPAE